MKRFISAFLFVLLPAFCAPVASAADVLPEARKSATWARANVGVVGGIPSGSGWTVYNVLAYGADPTGVSSSQAAYNAAYAAAGTNSIIYFPAGTYKVSNLVLAKTGIIIRGDGMFATTIRSTSPNPTVAIQGVDANHGNAYNITGDVISGLTKGSTAIRVRKTGTFSVADPFVAGKILEVTVPNDWEQPTMAYNQQDYIRRIFLYVTSVVNHGGSPVEWTLNFATPIPEDYVWTDVGLSAKADMAQAGIPVTRHTMGVEDMTLDAVDAFDGYSGAQSVLSFNSGAHSSWAKNVRTRNHTNYGVFLDGSLSRIELSGCFIQKSVSQSSTSRAGFVVYNVTAALFENNIVEQVAPGIMLNFGVSGCVIAYNAFLNDFIVLPPSVNVYGGAMAPNHSFHPSKNLWEGNYASSVNADSYHGSGDGDLFHANWISTYVARDGADWNTTTGLINTSAYHVWGLALKRFSRKYTAIGNIFGHPGFSNYPANDYYSFGQPNIGNSNYLGTQSLTGVGGASPWQDYNVALKRPYSWPVKLIAVRDFDVYKNFYTTYDFEVTGGDLTRMNARIATLTPYSGSAQFLFYPPSGAYGYYTGGETTAALVGNILTLTNGFLPPPALNTVGLLTPGPLGFQELDLDVEATTYLRGNVREDGAASRTQLAVGETRSPSYYYSAQPGFLTGYNWPPFDSTSPSGLNLRRIPAGDRYLTYVVNGTFDSTTVATPQFSPAAGTLAAGTTVTITSATTGSTIHYTTNGTTPTTGSAVYSTPISLSVGTTVVKALAVKATLTDSSVQTGTYVLVNVPTAPSALGATVAGTTQINLAWTDNSSTETGFRIERRLSGGAWGAVTTVAADVAAYNDTGLTAATAYDYRVYAVNVAGDSTVSNTASATTNANEGGTVPTAPSSLVASIISSTQINLTWADNSTTETSFRLERKVGAGAWSTAALPAANVTSYSDTGLTASTTYDYRIYAVNATGDSTVSNTASATTQSGDVGGAATVQTLNIGTLNIQ